MARDSRTETIHALDAFIATQQQLLTRQKEDIEHLQKLRNDIKERPSGVLSNLTDELDHSTFRLSAQTDLRLAFPQKIDWSVFNNSDTEPLRTLSSRLQKKGTVPPKTQQSPLSELQVLVKTAKKEVLDPILDRIAKSTMALHLDSDDEEDDIDPLERSRFEERTKIQELKNRRVRGGASGLSLLTTRNVVFVRDDLEDETGEVDIDSWGDGRKDRNKEKMRIRTDTSNQTIVERPTKTAKASSKTNGKPHTTISKNTSCPVEDDERPKKKARFLSSAKSGSHPKTEDCSSTLPSDDDDSAIVNGQARTPLSQEAIPSKKPRSETYKQAWSIDEQNLLEQLLESIPDGEKYRWLKISQAMGGRRTPRQVASHVQKYFEKLRKFGVTD